MINQTVEMVLAGLADAVHDKILPALADNAYASEQARLTWRLLTIISEQVDGLAAVRAAENAAMRALFGDAGPIVGGDLGAELTLAAGGTEPGLRIRELDREGGRLRSLLVELHAALEAIDTGQARAMHQRIWRLLQDMEMGRG